MPSKKDDKVGNPVFILDKLDAPPKEWRKSVAKVLITNDSKVTAIIKTVSRLEKEIVAVISILTIICAAVIKTALGL